MPSNLTLMKKLMKLLLKTKSWNNNLNLCKVKTKTLKMNCTYIKKKIMIIKKNSYGKILFFKLTKSLIEIIMAHLEKI